jgi:hypothetical protein
MSNPKVYQGQNFIDKVLESTGSSENAFEMALLNGFSLTDDVVIGQELQSSRVTRKGVVSIFKKDNRPASAIRTIAGAAIEEEGIGYMAIGNNFIVR